MKNSFAFLALLACLSCTSIAPTEQDKNDRPPNILFILTDDLGWGDLGTFYQNQRRETGDQTQPFQFTPHLDEMASQGIMLTDHYANAPVCAPSRASFLLGMHQGHANVRDNQFDKALEDNYTVANVVKEAGYHTVAVGKWGLQGDPMWESDGGDWPGHPLNRGFDEFYGYMRHRDGHEHYPVEGIYRGPKEVYHNHDNVAAGLTKCFTGDLWTAFAKKWIRDHRKSRKDQPFFMFLAFDTPHAVIELPTQEYPAGGGVEGGLQWLGEPGRMINTASGEVDSWVHPDYASATWDHDQDASTAEVPWPDTYKRFATVNRRIDDAVGDIRQLLQDLNIADNTMVIFTSDNGPSQESYLPEEYAVFTPEFFRSYGPFDGIKRDLWEGGIRVPAIVSWPNRVEQGLINSSPVMMSDWLATFAEVAGLEVPARTDSESMLPILEGREFTDQRPVYIEYFQNGRTPSYEHFLPNHTHRKRGQMQMIRIDNLVGVRYDIQSPEDDFEIYDIGSDPQQSRNLSSGTSEYEDLQQQLKARVLQMRMPDTSAVRPYDLELIPPVLKVENRLNRGLRVDWYQNESPWIPNVDQLEPVGTGSTDIVEPPFDVDGNLVVFHGYFQAPEDGSYSFQWSGNIQGLLRVHDALVVDADFYADGESVTGTIQLAEGFHPIRIYLKNNGNDVWDFDLKIKTPSQSGYSVITGQKFFH